MIVKVFFNQNYSIFLAYMNICVNLYKLVSSVRQKTHSYYSMGCVCMRAWSPLPGCWWILAWALWQRWLLASRVANAMLCVPLVKGPYFCKLPLAGRLQTSHLLQPLVCRHWESATYCGVCEKVMREGVCCQSRVCHLLCLSIKKKKQLQKPLHYVFDCAYYFIPCIC